MSDAMTPPAGEGGPQFGQRPPDGALDRPAAFGVVAADGRIACVRIRRPEGEWLDLPGGAIDPGEDEEAALRREFLEETGLKVRPVARLGAARQFIIRPGERLNNLCSLWAAVVEGREPSGKIEDDHELEWLDPLVAISELRHEAHAYALVLWLRRHVTPPS